MSEESEGERVSFTEAERRHRLDKLDALRERGINPYPVRFDREGGRAGPLHDELADLGPGATSDRDVALAGRVTAMRRHGGLDFADLRDETGQIQVMADRAQLGAEALADFTDLDLGDWIGVKGPVVRSEHGELSVRAESFELLSKAIRALPDFRKGLADPGDRYRRRYLDLIVDEPSRRIFAIRSRVISATRKVLLDRGFTEVETPVLLSQAGGAEARPFITHHNALDIDMYLRIALELPLKRLIVGGMNRVFEIGRVFRNEGLDTRHNPEFTLLEAYQAFGDYHDMMDLTEEIVATSCREAIGTTVVQIGGRDVDLKPPWRRATMAELIAEHAGVEMHPSMPVEEARAIAGRLGIEWLEVWGAGKIMAEVYDETCEAKLTEPTFVMDHPREVSPLARAHRDDPALTERFEMVVAARELANAYSELNDPIDQAERFQEEARLQAGGDEEVEPVDDDYVEALEYGLPPTGGLGIGMDRLVMLISGAEAIRDVILFPTLRPEGSGTGGKAAGGLARGDPGAAGGLAPADPEPAAPTPHPATVQAPADDRGRHRSRAPRVLAWLTALLGLASLLPTLPVLHVSLGIGDLLTRSDRADLFVVSALIGLGLITIANQLARRKHRAWVLVMALLGAAALIHILKGPDPIAAVLDIAMLVALASYRTEFRARGERSSLRQAIAFVPLFLIVVIAFGFVSLLTQRDHVEPALSVGGMLDATFSGLLGGDGPYTYGHKIFADFFSDALLALGIAGLVIFLYLVFRSVAIRDRPARSERERAREIVHAYGTDTLAYFALRRDKSYFFSSDGRSLIAYAYVRGYAMVAADPIGPPEDTGRTIDEFLAFCDTQGWAVAFLAVRESDLPLYADRGMHSLYLGDEAILAVQDFTLEGAEMKAVRGAVNRIGRDHDFELIREPDASADLVTELNEISAEWRDGASERGFTMELGQDVEGTDPDFVIAIARERAGGRVAGFLRFVPCFGPDPGYSLDLMRRRPDSANGLTEYLIASAALELEASGVERLSLNFAAWGRLLDDADGAGLWGRIERRMARALNPYFQIQSLRDFNQKFDPEWLPRSIVIDDPGDLPKVTVLYASVEGFLELPLLGRFLEPPVRAAERGEAVRSAGAG